MPRLSDARSTIRLAASALGTLFEQRESTESIIAADTLEDERRHDYIELFRGEALSAFPGRQTFQAFFIGAIDLIAAIGTMYMLWSWMDTGSKPYFFFEEFRIIVALHVFILSFYAGLHLEEIPAGIHFMQEQWRAVFPLRPQPSEAATSGTRPPMSGLFQSAIFPTFIVLLIAIIFVAPLVPGIERAISKFQVGDVNIELARYGNRNEKLILTRERVDRSVLGKAYLVKWIIPQDFFIKNQRRYEIQYKSNKLLDIKRNGITASEKIFQAYIVPYVLCVRSHIEISGGFVDQDTLRTAPIANAMRFFAMAVDTQASDFSQKNSVAPKLIDNLRQSDEILRKAEGILKMISQEQGRLRRELDWSPLENAGLSDERSSCSEPRIRPDDATQHRDDGEKLVNALAVSYIPAFIADAQWFSFDSDSAWRFMAGLKNLSRIYELEINYKSFLAARSYLSQHSPREVVEYALAYKSLLEGLGPVRDGVRQVALLADGGKRRCSSVSQKHVNSQENPDADFCAEAYWLELWRGAMNIALSAVNDAIVSDFVRNEANVTKLADRRVREVFRDYGALFYNSASTVGELTQSIIAGSMSSYASRLYAINGESGADALVSKSEYFDNITTIQLFNVFRLVLDKADRKNRVQLREAVDVAIQTFEEHIEYLERLPEKQALFATPREYQRRESEGNLILLKQLKEQLEDGS